MSRLGKLLVSAAAGAIAIFGLAAVPAGVARADAVARADIITPVPITGFWQMVVDSAHGHIFISEPNQNGILVTDLAGNVVTTITGQSGVSGMTLSADGSTLYAALSTGGAVTAISTASLTQTASYSLGTGLSPIYVAVQSGKIWVSYVGSPSGPAIGDLNLATSPPSFETQAAMGGWYNAPLIAVDPSDGGVLVAANTGVTPVAVTSFNVAVDPATVTATTGPSGLSACGGYAVPALAVVPGGKEFLAPCDNAAYRFSTATLNEVGSYPSAIDPSFPNTVAIAPNGTVATGVMGQGQPTSPAPPADVYVYGQDGTSPLRTYDLWNSYNILAGQGLAWSADGSKLFAITYDSRINSNGKYNFYLHVFYPSLTASTITMSGPSNGQSTYGQSVSITGQLTLASGTLPSGATVTITRKGADSTQQFTVPVAANGSFKLTDTPPDAGAFTYTADYTGTSTIAPASSVYDLTVNRAPTSLKITTGVLIFNYGQTISITAHLGTTYTNRTVSIYVQPFGSSTLTLLKTGTVNSNGALSTSYRAVNSIAFVAKFTGDAHYLPVTTRHSVGVRVAIPERQSGYYASTRIKGVLYRLYHSSKPLYVWAAVTPNKHGQCVNFEYQEYYKGKWYDYNTGCIALSSSSQITVKFNISRIPLGVHYRIRADYERGSDTTNLNNDSLWQYFMAEH